MELTKVSEQEFTDFVETYYQKYGRKLAFDVYGACEPPLITYNDFSFGKWPDSVVAETHAYSDDPNDYYYEPKENRKYFIVKDKDLLKPQGKYNNMTLEEKYHKAIITLQAISQYEPKNKDNMWLYDEIAHVKAFCDCQQAARNTLNILGESLLCVGEGINNEII